MSSFGRYLLAWACSVGTAMPAGAQDVLLFRHATAPGFGDPPDFRLGDCSTQRNLDEAGRAEARRIGEQVRARGIRVSAVRTSQWCRTRETAALAFPGHDVRDEPAFNSFFAQEPAEGDAATARARELLGRWRGPGTLVVVTHQVNIAALTGVNPKSGEGVLLRRDRNGEFRVAGRLAP